jgi:hypothetical protein
MFLFNKIKEDGRTGSAQKQGVGWGWGEVAQCIHMKVNVKTITKNNETH